MLRALWFKWARWRCLRQASRTRSWAAYMERGPRPGRLAGKVFRWRMIYYIWRTIRFNDKHFGPREWRQWIRNHSSDPEASDIMWGRVD